jgi:hypothetical protein
MKKEKIFVIAIGFAMIAAVIIAITIKPDPQPTINPHQSAIDSVNNIWRNRQVQLSDSLKNSYLAIAQDASQKAEISQANARKERIKSNKLQAKLDSLQNSGADCPEMFEACIETNGSLRAEIAELDTTIRLLDIEAQQYSLALYECENQRATEKAILSDCERANLQKDSLLIEAYKTAEKERKRTKSAIFWGNVKAGAALVLGVLVGR